MCIFLGNSFVSSWNASECISRQQWCLFTCLFIDLTPFDPWGGFSNIDSKQLRLQSNPSKIIGRSERKATSSSNVQVSVRPCEAMWSLLVAWHGPAWFRLKSSLRFPLVRHDAQSWGLSAPFLSNFFGTPACLFGAKTRGMYPVQVLPQRRWMAMRRRDRKRKTTMYLPHRSFRLWWISTQ